MITVYLYNYIQTVSNQVHTQNLTYNYTIIMYTNLNINLYSSMYIQIPIRNHVFYFYDKSASLHKSRKKHFYPGLS